MMLMGILIVYVLVMLMIMKMMLAFSALSRNDDEHRAEDDGTKTKKSC